jgi:ADP-ribose pyrophosphatase YjhB (NUDIX family)
MLPAELFHHCPRCGAASPAGPGANPFECPGCGLVLFFNPTVAAAAFVFDPAGRALFIRRAREPAKGKLAIPGGFIDVGETAEAALRRETREEVGIEIDRVAYLGSCTNEYPYRGVTYPVVDLVFTAAAVDPGSAKALDGVAGLEWKLVAEVDPDELAFPSLRMGRELLKSRDR